MRKSIKKPVALTKTRFSGKPCIKCANHIRHRSNGGCVACQKTLAARRRTENKSSQILARRLKDEVMAAYGNKCACCKEGIRQFLTIDHIEPIGGGRRRKGANTGSKLYRRLRREGFPSDKYRCLCFNCNVGRHINGGICPHMEASK